MESQAIRAFVRWAGSQAENNALPASMASYMPEALAGEAQPAYKWRGLWPKGIIGRDMAIMVCPGVKDLIDIIPPPALRGSTSL